MYICNTNRRRDYMVGKSQDNGSLWWVQLGVKIKGAAQVALGQVHSQQIARGEVLDQAVQVCGGEVV